MIKCFLSIRSLTLLILLFLFSSCEKIIKMDIKDDRRRIVVNSFFSPDNLFSVNISKSLHILDNGEFQYIPDATVILYKNDILLDTLIYNNYGNYIANLLPEINANYKITVTANGLESIVASDAVPSPIHIVSVDTATVMYSQNNGMDGSNPAEEMLRCKIKFQDQPGVKNYYLLQVLGHEYHDYGPKTGEVNLWFDTDDPSVEDETVSDAGATFTDALFDGKLYDFTIYINNRQTSNVYIVLASISKDFYLYWTSYTQFNYGDNSPFSEPVLVYNNIDKGFGIFAGYTKSTDTLVFSAFGK